MIAHLRIPFASAFLEIGVCLTCCVRADARLNPLNVISSGDVFSVDVDIQLHPSGILSKDISNVTDAQTAPHCGLGVAGVESSSRWRWRGSSTSSTVAGSISLVG